MTEPVDYHQMADDYGALFMHDFNTKYGHDWYERHREGLAAEFARRARMPKSLLSPLPPAQPPGWVDPDPLTVEPEPVRRHRPYQGWELEEPISHRAAWLGLGICIGIVIFALVFTIVRQLDPAPSSGQTTDPIDLSRASSAALSGAPDALASQRSDGCRQSECAAGRAGALPPLAVTPVPSPSGEIIDLLGTGGLVGGLATWYDDGPGYYAAAGPDLRRALGKGWRHSLVTVQGPGRFSVEVELTDSCACGSRHGAPTVLDLSPAAFRELAPLSAGIVAVSIDLAQELPRTDADIRMMLEARDDEAYR